MQSAVLPQAGPAHTDWQAAAQMLPGSGIIDESARSPISGIEVAMVFTQLRLNAICRVAFLQRGRVQNTDLVSKCHRHGQQVRLIWVVRGPLHKQQQHPTRKGQARIRTGGGSILLLHKPCHVRSGSRTNYRSIQNLCLCHASPDVDAAPLQKHLPDRLQIIYHKLAPEACHEGDVLLQSADNLRWALPHGFIQQLRLRAPSRNCIYQCDGPGMRLGARVEASGRIYFTSGQSQSLTMAHHVCPVRPAHIFKCRNVNGTPGLSAESLLRKGEACECCSDLLSPAWPHL